MTGCFKDVFLGRSLDFSVLPPPLIVREIYRRTINLEESGTGRRWSIVTGEDDLGPRTLWVERLDPLQEGWAASFSFHLREVPVVYDPSFVPGAVAPRWRALVREWGVFLMDDDLLPLKEPAERCRWNELLGLGAGSTPAGDDYLSGYATGVLWRKGALPFSLDLGRTAWLSGEILRDSMNGKIWRRGKILLEALTLENGDVPGIAGRIAAWGHSSGRAWLAGLGSAILQGDG